MAAIHRKLVIVGDSTCGKTCLLFTFAKDEFPDKYIPTVFENYVSITEVDETLVELALWDTSGLDDYDSQRPHSYPDTDIILVCFAIDNPNSFANLHTKWVPEVKHFCPNVPFLLIATKKDLRDYPAIKSLIDRNEQQIISREQGHTMSERVGVVTTWSAWP